VPFSSLSSLLPLAFFLPKALLLLLLLFVGLQQKMPAGDTLLVSLLCRSFRRPATSCSILHFSVKLKTFKFSSFIKSFRCSFSQSTSHSPDCMSNSIT